VSVALGQLPLPFVHRPDYTEAAFVAAPSNAEALAWLGRTPDWPGGRLALWGEAGCGKTHLLRIWAARTGATVLDGGALPGASLKGLPAGLPEGPPRGPLAVDDAERALKGAKTALLHLLNAAAEEGHPVLLCSRLPPSRWKVRLADLRSRLRAVTSVRIAPADDELLQVLLRRLLADRQLAVPAPVQDWLLRRLPRSPEALREAAARLDLATLAAGRSVTRATAAQVLGEMEGR
jgi:DnaA regulatory inactivator Hda